MTDWDCCLFSKQKNKQSVVLACAVLRVFNLFERDKAVKTDILLHTLQFKRWLINQYSVIVICGLHGREGSEMSQDLRTLSIIQLIS